MDNDIDMFIDAFAELQDAVWQYERHAGYLKGDAIKYADRLAEAAFTMVESIHRNLRSRL